MGKFTWTQSALKDFENPSTCPLRWRSQWIDQLFRSPTTEAQSYGNYFEFLCIGKNAKGTNTTDLPRTGKGEKTAVQKRIESQANTFKELFDPLAKSYLGYIIDSLQFDLVGMVADLAVSGQADIIAKEASTGQPVIIDLKLTEDSFSDRSPYGWGQPIEVLDLIQQVLYQELYRQMFGVVPKMVLLIFEHGTKERVRVLDLTLSEAKLEEAVRRFTQGQEIFDLYEKNGWVTDPSVDECKRCSLADCKARKYEQKIIYESIRY